MADKPAKKYRVIGERAVAGVAPGGTYTDDGTLNVRALIKSRHLQPLATGGKVKGKTTLGGGEVV